MGVVSTALSALAFDYPAEKLSVYVSDDGGADVTLFAFMEGARFARHWLPFCRENGVKERSPEAFFASGCSAGDDEENLKVIFILFEGKFFAYTHKERRYKNWFYACLPCIKMEQRDMPPSLHSSCLVKYRIESSSKESMHFYMACC